MSEPKRVGRRTFLNYAIAVVATGVIVGAATYFAVPKGEVTVTAPGTTVTTTVTGTPTTPPTTSPTTSPTTTSIKPATLAYLSESGPEPELVAETFKWYNQAFPGVPITFKPDICDRTVSRQKYMGMLTEKRNDYQLYWCWLQWTRWFVAHDALEPLENIMPSDLLNKFKSALPKWIIKFIEIDGKTYNLPIYYNSLCLFYRKDLFEDPKEKENFKAKYGYELRPPRTWKEWVDVAKFFTRPDKELWGTTVDGKAWAFFYNEFIYGNVGKLDYVDVKNKTTTINSPYFVQLFETLAELAKVSPPGWEEGDWFTFGDPMFAQGKLAMWHNWWYPWPTFQDPGKSKVAGKVGVAPTPTIDESTIPNPAASGGGVTVFKFATEEQKMAAREYLTWLLSDPIQEKMALTGALFLPSRVDILQKPTVSSLLQAQPFLELGEKLGWSLQNLDTLEYEAFWVDASTEAFMKVVKGEMKAKEALDWYAEYIVKTLREHAP